MVKLATLAAGEWGVTGEDRMASVSASLAVASVNCDVAVSLQVLCTFLLEWERCFATFVGVRARA